MFPTSVFLLVFAALAFNGLLFPHSFMARNLLPVLVAAQCMFCGVWAQQLKHKPAQYMLLALVVAALVYVLYSGNRAAIAGLLAAWALWAYITGRWQKAKHKWLWAAGVVVALAILVFWVKTGSSKGRWLIYKVIAANTTVTDYVPGIGPGNFKNLYNNWQANYFEQRDINSAEALLADNTYFAFNNYLQFVLETGITGLFTLLLVALVFITVIRRLKHNPHTTAIAVLCSTTVIATAALFGYPLHNTWLLACAVLGLAAAYVLPLNKQAIKLVMAAGLVEFVILFINTWQYRAIEQQVQKADEYGRTGRKQAALQAFKQLLQKGHCNNQIKYGYARELYHSGQPAEALKYLQPVNLQTTRLLAQVYEALNDTTKAEQYYRKAVYMVPNRFESRRQLTEYYLRLHDTVKARYWASSILQLPVKVPSAQAERIKARAKRLLELKFPQKVLGSVEM